MAISKDKKKTLVADLTELLSSSKTTVYARYQGLTVAELQELRKAAREAGVKIKVTKNRLVRVAMDSVAVYKDTDTTNLVGQLLYAISDTDEVAPAKVLANFAKTHDMLVVAGGFNDAMLLKSSEGKVMGTCLYKSVPAKYMMEENGGEKSYRVYSSKEEALKEDGKAISKYQLWQIPDNNWSVRLILRGLIQSNHHDAEAKKSKESEDKWEAVKECWIAVREGKAAQIQTCQGAPFQRGLNILFAQGIIAGRELP